MESAEGECQSYIPASALNNAVLDPGFVPGNSEVNSHVLNKDNALTSDVRIRPLSARLKNATNQHPALLLSTQR